MEMWDKFDYENLILEGGGAKGFAYIGALQYLEDNGKLQQFKRFGGASAGAIIATLLAVGADCKTIRTMTDIPMNNIAEDACCSSWSFWKYIPMIRNIMTRFGWHSGDPVLQYMQENIKTLCGNGDITFEEVYKMNGNELCIVVANVTKMTIQLFHPKVTPDVPVALAVRMSMAIPGYFEPVHYKHHGNDCVFVDGGLLCNYPLHCYDGWYLSMKPEDCFLNRLANQRAKNPFGPINDKTLGMVVFSATENDYMKPYVQKRNEIHGGDPPARPDTELASTRAKKVKETTEQRKYNRKLIEAAYNVGKIIVDDYKSVGSGDACITKETVIKTLNKIGEENYRLLTGEEFAPEKIYENMTKECEHISGEDEAPTAQTGVRYSDLVRFLDRKGILFRELHRTSPFTSETSNIATFFMSVISSIILTADRYYLQKEDAARTVGIDTDYIELLDFELAEGDKEYLLKQGERAMQALLFEKNADRAILGPRGPGGRSGPIPFPGIETDDEEWNFTDNGISIFD